MFCVTSDALHCTLQVYQLGENAVQGLHFPLKIDMCEPEK